MAEDVPPQKKARRKVRFSLFREVRRLPESIANEAKRARLPYRPPILDCKCANSPLVKYTLYFAPMWFLSSVSYQAALAFSSVSSVNLISASSSLFVLILSALMSRRAADRFTFSKLLLVVVNLSGVAIVSNFSPSLVGSGLSLFSAFAYALYLAVFSTFSAKHGRIDMNLMFGVIGLFSLFICTPLMVLVHESGLEPQLPPPTMLQFGLVALNGLVGSVLTDYMWLYA
jgi:solute carrier family 35 protein F5